MVFTDTHARAAILGVTLTLSADRLHSQAALRQSPFCLHSNLYSNLVRPDMTFEVDWE